MVCRLRIGHCQITHGYFMKGLEAPTCEKCNNVPQTVKHLLEECPQFESYRQKTGLARTLKEILQDIEEIFNTLFEFLKLIEYYKRI